MAITPSPTESHTLESASTNVGPPLPYKSPGYAPVCSCAKYENTGTAAFIKYGNNNYTSMQ